MAEGERQRRTFRFLVTHAPPFSSLPPSVALLAPFKQKVQRRASKEGWIFKRQLSNFAHKEVTEGTVKILSSETLSAETKPVRRTKQLHILILFASYL